MCLLTVFILWIETKYFIAEETNLSKLPFSSCYICNQTRWWNILILNECFELHDDTVSFYLNYNFSLCFSSTWLCLQLCIHVLFISWANYSLSIPAFLQAFGTPNKHTTTMWTKWLKCSFCCLPCFSFLLALSLPAQPPLAVSCANLK